MIAPRARRRTGTLLAVAVAVAVAGLVAIWSGLTVRSTSVPAVDVVLHPGQATEVEGLRIRFDGFETVTSVPRIEPTEPPWRAPAGAVALVARYTVELADPAATGSDKLCTISLRSGSLRSGSLRSGDTTWSADAAVLSGAPTEAGQTCVPYDDQWKGDPRRPRPVAIAFVLPAAGVAGAEARLDFWYDQRTVIALRGEATPADPTAPGPSRSPAASGSPGPTVSAGETPPR